MVNLLKRSLMMRPHLEGDLLEKAVFVKPLDGHTPIKKGATEE